jgi:hypothetical protein
MNDSQEMLGTLFSVEFVDGNDDEDRCPGTLHDRRREGNRMSYTQSEADADLQSDIIERLRSMLDVGLDKGDERKLVDIIKQLAVIAVRESQSES